MKTPIKVTGFALGLLAVFAAATGLGTLVGPVRAAQADNSAEVGGHGTTHSGTEPAAQGELPGGLMVSQGGYSLNLAQRQVPSGASTPITFRILGPDGEPVTNYTPEHGKDLHLIAVRRDLTGFQHVHPQLAPGGTWTAPLNLARGGVYRIIADFTPVGRAEGLALGADLSVAGVFDPQPLPAVSRSAQVAGYTVTLDGILAAGEESKLTLSVSKDGKPVTDLQPYLEAYGHLVALRDRDLAYLHVHPAGSPDDGKTTPGPGITFYATAPSAGAYRLFLDFQHGDTVRTAEFTATATATATHGHRANDQAGSASTEGGTPGPTSSTTASADGEEQPEHRLGG